MVSFDKAIKKHLDAYRRDVLCVAKKGEWRRKEYGHILPDCCGALNILQEYRHEFFSWQAKSKVKLHQFFHHLNSSQAACFNLFFPPVWLNNDAIVFETLGIDEGNIECWAFEKVVDKAEGTNFDFYLELKSGAKIYVEFKYSENKFGKAEINDKRREKLRTIYKSKLKNKVADKYLKEAQFFKHYQILRNLVYFQPERGDQVIFIYPKANEKLCGTPALLDDIVPDSQYRNAIKVRYWEDAVDGITAFVGDNNLRNHYRQYQQKYLPGSE